MALITRYLIIDALDNVLAVKYNRDAAWKACQEWRESGRDCGVWCETSILSNPEYSQEVCILKLSDPLPKEE